MSLTHSTTLNILLNCFDEAMMSLHCFIEHNRFFATKFAFCCMYYPKITLHARIWKLFGSIFFFSLQVCKRISNRMLKISILVCFILVDPSKGQLILKANCQAVNSSKKRMNEFVFSSMRRVFICFLEEIEDSKKAFWNYLTFREYLFTTPDAVKIKERARIFKWFKEWNSFFVISNTVQQDYQKWDRRRHSKSEGANFDNFLSMVQIYICG